MNKLDVKQGEWVDYLYETYPDSLDVIQDLKSELHNTSLEQLVSEADGYEITETVGDICENVMSTYGLDYDDEDEELWSDLCQLVWDHYGLLDTTDVETDVKKLLGG